jgi:hypothetical protein
MTFPKNNKIAVGVGAIAAAALGGAVLLHLNASPEKALEGRWAFTKKYCTDCHNDAELTGGLSFEGRKPGDVHKDAKIWEAAIRKLELGLMPPRDQPQPPKEAREEFVAALVGTLDDAAAAAPQPFVGSVPLHRLNREEYANAIRDLLALDVDVSELLPSDGGDFGFDNIASVLRTSPLLLERYLTVAQRVGDLAVGDPKAVPSSVFYKIPVEVTQDKWMEGLPLGTRGGILVHHTFPADAEYVLSGRLLRTVAEGYVGVEGHDVPHEFIITVDGEQVFSVPVGGKDDHEASSKSITLAQVEMDRKMTSPRIPVTAGPHELAFTWIDMPEQEQNVWQPALRETLEAHNPAGIPRLESAIIEGPYDASGVSSTPSRDRIFVCKPASAAEEPACAKQIVATLARRAFRKPAITDEDVAEPLKFYTAARANGGSFDEGIRASITRMLVSPEFLFRAEQSPADLPAGSAHRISDTELASRLSFFLWSSIPDDELLDAAGAGNLHEPKVLEAQVRRMVADERAESFVENFVGQWLQLRNLEARVRPDLLMFPDFDDNLRKAFRRETELLFQNVLRENHSVLEILNANYTFVNERLAKHYGIPGIYGAQFRKVQLTDPNRWGLLGHGSFLSLTSAATRTSPIIRGKYVMANLLNSPPPQPPAVVPALEASKPKDRPSTVRETLELHRADPVCASCHNNIDPIGFALEKFDTVGKWHDTTPEGLPIDSAGVLADGTPVDGPVQLREALLKNPNIFAGTVTEKLMIYALGRGLEPADMPTVRAILRNAAKDDYRIMSIVLGIVDSLPFQMRAKPDAPETVAQALE